MNIFQLTDKWINVIKTIEDHEDDLPDELLEKFSNIETDYNNKIVGYAYIIKTFESESAIIDKEIKRLQAMKKSKDTKINNLKTYVLNSLKSTGVEIKTPTLTVKTKNNPPATIIDDESQIPDKYKTMVTTVKISKVDIKNDIVDGATVPGAHLEIRQSLFIK